MIEINLEQYKSSLKVSKKDGDTYIFDPIRRKDIKLLPEELVRQLFLQYLLQEKAYSQKLIRVEKALNINGQIKRFDIVIYNNQAHPMILIECKRAEEKIKQSVFNQISTYNLALRADYMIVTNGHETHCCKMNYEDSSYEFIDSVPSKLNITNN